MNDRAGGMKVARGIPLRLEAAPGSEASTRALDKDGAASASSTEPSLVAALADLPALLASAPHRMMFFAGASAVIVSMLWWACFLGAAYFGHAFPASPVPAGWAHAVFTQYGMLVPF